MALYKKFLSYIPVNMRVPLIVALVWNCTVFSATRLVNRGMPHFDLTTGVDGFFPFLPWTVYIYFGSFVFWAVNYIIAARDKERNWRFFAADFFAKIICLFIFIALPTSIVRPVLTETGAPVSDFLMRFLYWIDSPDNLFPSLHCLVSWFCVIAVRKNKRAPKWYRAASVIITVAICICTLTTKQHVFVDTVSGIVLAELCYQLTYFIKIPQLYRKAFLRMDKKHQSK